MNREAPERQAVSVAACSIEPWQVTRRLMVVATALVVAGVAGQMARFVLGCHNGFGLIAAFDLNAEQSIPNWFSASLLLFASLLLAVIAASSAGSGRHRGYWASLSLLFALLSLDEASAIHEKWSKVIHHCFSLSKGFPYAWVLPGGFFAALLGLAYLPFLRSLPHKTFRLLMVAAVVYLSGALGMEAVSSYWHAHFGRLNLAYSMLSAAEETLEMSGAIILIHALLSCMRTMGINIKFLLGEDRGRGGEGSASRFGIRL